MSELTIKDQINNWLQSPEKDYHAGIALLSQITRNRILVHNLSKKNNAYNRDKINYELSKFAEADYKPLAPEEKPESEPTAEEVKEYVDGEIAEQTRFIESLPSDVQLIVKEKRALYNLRNKASQWLVENTKDEEELSQEAKAKTKEVLDLDEQIKALDSQLEYFWEYKTLPAPSGQKVAESTGITADQKEAKLQELEKKLKNQKTYVSKAEKKVAANPKNIRHAEDLAKKKAEYDELRYQRDILKNQVT
jgi:hypothetical protein